MPELPVRFYPPDLAATEGLDAPSRGADRRVEFVYWINRYPQSRCDKSQQCDGHVRVSRDGTAVRDGRLDDREFCTLG